MTQTVFLHDGSTEGFLTALDLALAAAANCAVECETGWNEDLFVPAQRVRTDPTRAASIACHIRQTISDQAYRRTLYLLLSEEAGHGHHVVEYLQLGMQKGRSVDEFEAHPAVRTMQHIARRVGGEIHRLKGLLRFRELSDGRFWAPVAPDANILVPLALHFRRRLPRQVWVIHDTARGYAVCWNGHTLTPIQNAGLELQSPDFATNEQQVQALWKTFFRTVAIPERNNRKLQRQFMPVRYWQHLIETAEINTH